MNKTANLQDTQLDEGSGIDWSFVLQGAITVLVFLAGLAFWATFIYSMVSGNVKLAMAFGQAIGVIVGVAVPIMIIKKLLEYINQ